MASAGRLVATLTVIKEVAMNKEHSAVTDKISRIV